MELYYFPSPLSSNPPQPASSSARRLCWLHIGNNVCVSVCGMCVYVLWGQFSFLLLKHETGALSSCLNAHS